MKAKPYNFRDGSYHPCDPQQATHVMLHTPGPFLNRLAPVILKGSRDQCERVPVWTWNGDTEKPTLKPSILTKGIKELTDEQLAEIKRGGVIESIPVVCHTFINDGRVQFLSDCTHEFAGRTMDLLDVD